jgi:hypothetical protein
MSLIVKPFFADLPTKDGLSYHKVTLPSPRISMWSVLLARIRKEVASANHSNIQHGMKLLLSKLSILR